MLVAPPIATTLDAFVGQVPVAPHGKGLHRQLVAGALHEQHGPVDRQRRSTIALANSEHLTSVAPSIRRAKS